MTTETLRVASLVMPYELQGALEVIIGWFKYVGLWATLGKTSDVFNLDHAR